MDWPGTLWRWKTCYLNKSSIVSFRTLQLQKRNFLPTTLVYISIAYNVCSMAPLVLISRSTVLSSIIHWALITHQVLFTSLYNACIISTFLRVTLQNYYFYLQKQKWSLSQLVDVDRSHSCSLQHPISNRTACNYISKCFHSPNGISYGNTVI